MNVATTSPATSMCMLSRLLNPSTERHCGLLSLPPPIYNCSMSIPYPVFRRHVASAPNPASEARRAAGGLGRCFLGRVPSAYDAWFSAPCLVHSLCIRFVLPFATAGREY
jgi:hypothetical protein